MGGVGSELPGKVGGSSDNGRPDTDYLSFHVPTRRVARP